MVAHAILMRRPNSPWIAFLEVMSLDVDLMLFLWLSFEIVVFVVCSCAVRCCGHDEVV